MYRIRYYQFTYHPDHFKGTWLGWWIRTVNWARWKLEVYVQRCVMGWLFENKQLPGEKRNELLRLFSLDVEAEKLEKERTSPEIESIEPTVRAERYRAGRAQGALEAASEQGKEDAGELPLRPEPIDGLAARYGSTSSRGRRYARGRHKFNLSDEEDVEAVESPTPLQVLKGGKSWKK